jgi:hypothetical protein
MCVEKRRNKKERENAYAAAPAITIPAIARLRLLGLRVDEESSTDGVALFVGNGTNDLLEEEEEPPPASWVLLCFFEVGWACAADFLHNNLGKKLR